MTQMEKTRNQSRQSALWIIAGIIIVVFLGMFNIGKNTSLRIVGDEFGYWTAGAVFAGLDWSSVASHNFYYSYGYGPILASLLKLGTAQTLKYQIAIGINVLMLVAVYVMAYRILRKAGTKPASAAMIALVGVLYTGSMSYSQYTLAETLILFLYTIILLFFYSYLIKDRLSDVILLVLVPIYLCAVHMRTVGVVVVTFGFVGIYGLVKRRYKLLIVFALVVAVSLAIYLGVTKWYQQLVNTYKKNNQASAQVGKLSRLMTVEGFSLFLRGYVGKTAYSVLASFSLVAVAFFRVIRNAFTEIRARKLRNETVMGLFLVMSLLAMQAVSSIFLLNYRGRYDLLTYGRYHDFTIGAVIVYELYMGLVRREKLCLPQLLLSALAVVALTGAVLLWLPDLKVSAQLNLFSPGIYTFLKKRDKLFWLLALNIVVLLVYCFFVNTPKEFYGRAIFRTLAVSVMLAGLFIYTSNKALARTYSWSIESCAQEEKLARMIQKDSTVRKLWYYVPDSPIRIDFLQFLLQDMPITCFSDTDLFSKMGEGDRILTTNNSRLITEEWKEQYEQLGRSSQVKLWKKKQTE